MNKWRQIKTILLGVLLTAGCATAAQPPQTETPPTPIKETAQVTEPEPHANVPTAELIAGITKQEPVHYYLLSARLLKEGRADEAVFWYYAGQLRWRYYALAHPEKASGGESSALMGAFHHSLGTPINEYAFGDLEQLRKTIDDVIRWDEENPNEFCPKESVQKERAEVLEGLRKLSQSTIDTADEIRKTRTKNGLPNR